MGLLESVPVVESPEDLHPHPATFQEALKDVQEANALVQRFPDQSGRVLHFLVKRMRNHSFPERDPSLWRLTLRVLVAKIPKGAPPPTEESSLAAPGTKVLNYRQFYQLYRIIKQQKDLGKDVLKQKLRSSQPEDEDEDLCPICFASRADIALSNCNHAFCEKCIKEWQQRSETCPLCRDKTDASEEAWVLTASPPQEPHDVAAYLSQFLDEL